MSASNSIKPMKLFYDHNIVTHKAALILVNSAINYNGKNLPWKNAEQNGLDAQNLFKTTFGFEDVTILTNGTKQ